MSDTLLPIPPNNLETPGGGRPKRPRIQVNNRQLRNLTADVLASLHDSGYGLYVRGNKLAGIALDEYSRSKVQVIEDHLLRAIMARSADYFTQDSGGPVACAPPMVAVKDILALPAAMLGFRPLIGISEIPILRPDGTIFQKHGYDADTRLYLELSPDLLDMPTVPEHPTREDIAEALGIIDDTIGEFPFVDQASRANAIGAMLTPVLRPVIEGPTPLAVVDAPAAGTGKTLFAEVISIVASGREAALLSAPDDGAEWRKQLTSVLLEGSQVVVIDNINVPLHSGELCRVLTATTSADRILGKNEVVTLPVRCTWLATGNNVRVAGDMPRRCCWIRMDPKTARPYERTGFRHPDLKQWVKQNRGLLLWALLTLARAWFDAGCPQPSTRPPGSYEHFGTVIGGVLQYAGVPGFLANSREMHNAADVETVEWEAFLLAVGAMYGDESFLTSELATVILNAPGDTAFSEDEESRALSEALPDAVLEVLGKPGPLRQRLGREFGLRVGRRFGDSQVWIEKVGQFRRATRWRIRVG